MDKTKGILNCVEKSINLELRNQKVWGIICGEEKNTTPHGKENAND